MSDADAPKSRVSPWLATMFRPVHWGLLRFYFWVRVRGADQLPAEGPVILAPTHRTRWDTLMIYEAVKHSPRRLSLRFLTSHNEVDEGIQGWVVRRLGAFPINTRRPTPGALKHCGELLLGGEALVIFPEGDIFRLPPGEVHPLKPGTAWIALQVQEALGETPLTIVPIRLGYSDRFLGYHSRAEVDVLPPIRVADYLDRPKKAAITAITADLQRALGDTVNDAPRAVVDAIARGRTPPDVEASRPDAA